MKAKVNVKFDPISQAMFPRDVLGVFQELTEQALGNIDEKRVEYIGKYMDGLPMSEVMGTLAFMIGSSIGGSMADDNPPLIVTANPNDFDDLKVDLNDPNYLQAAKVTIGLLVSTYASIMLSIAEQTFNANVDQYHRDKAQTKNVDKT